MLHSLWSGERHREHLSPGARARCTGPPSAFNHAELIEPHVALRRMSVREPAATAIGACGRGIARRREREPHLRPLGGSRHNERALLLALLVLECEDGLSKVERDTAAAPAPHGEKVGAIGLHAWQRVGRQRHACSCGRGRHA